MFEFELGDLMQGPCVVGRTGTSWKFSGWDWSEIVGVLAKTGQRLEITLDRHDGDERGFEREVCFFCVFSHHARAFYLFFECRRFFPRNATSTLIPMYDRIC